MSRPGDGPDPAADPIEAAVRGARGVKIDGHAVAFMICAAIRVPALMAAALPRIAPQLFRPDEVAPVLLWKAAAAVARRHHGAVPSDPRAARDLVALQCSRELAADPHRAYYTLAAADLVLADGGLLDDMVELAPGPEVADAGFEVLTRFLTERTVSDPVRRALAGIGSNDVISDPGAVVRAIEARTRDLVGLAVDPGSAAVTSGYVPRGRRAVTTKLGFLDKLMGGGHADCEAYCLLGPSSGGKTSLAVQLALEAAELEAAVAAEIAERPREWYYFTWELTELQLRDKVYSYGARIAADSIRAFADQGVPFSTAADPATLKPYEYEPYVNSPGNPLMGELERRDAFERRSRAAGNNFVIVDYSGQVAGHGNRGLDEAVAYLRARTAGGRRVAGVVIDYAGLVLNRMITNNNRDDDAIYAMLANFGNRVRTEIALPFQCRAWVLHQLKGDAAKKKYGKLHYSDARGCRNFADNFDFSIEFSKYHETSGVVEFGASKHRFAAASDGTVARFNGQFGAFMDMDEEYVRDPHTGLFVPRAFVDQVPAPARPAGPKPPFNPRDGVD